MWSVFRDLFYPKACRVCTAKLNLIAEHDSPGMICSSCWAKIEYILPPYCLRCGHSAGDGFSPHCKYCQELNISFSFARAVARYSGTMREAIHLLKFRYKLDLVQPLSNLMVTYFNTSRDFARIQTESGKFDYLVPIPLHKTKLRDREFNQVELLTSAISRQLGIPLNSGNLYRRKQTKPQMLIPEPTQRRKNVQDAFAVHDPTQFTGKKVLLIDDVMTTGATVNECSREVMKAGSSVVAVLVLARG